ncbi:grasp-with-spasm system ATP-grasp peptide maturase [Dokdonia sp.]|uniref:grasp-with-spasm system ATP-grasp peptide maturase n=1 Tax=Dokdonia sp. TaxID=2024995 RepID=UPI0032633CEF
MILIKSNAQDYSTTQVIKWLLHLEKPYLRINDTTPIDNITTDEDDISITADAITFNTKDIQSYWYRRGAWASTQRGVLGNIKQRWLYHYLKYFTKEAEKDIVELIESQLQGNALNTFLNSSNINKVKVLKSCRALDIAVPETTLTNTREGVSKFIQIHGDVITKAVNNIEPNIKGECFIDVTTKLITQDNVGQLPEKFHISIFQKLIKKQFEIRTFFLVDRFYSMAIFSQSDDQTKVDFRNYNFQKPNRVVPYNLPMNIESKLRKLLAEYTLKSASLDLIYSEEGAYIFLEINPIGQYDMVSVPCNYYLDLEIAKHL